MRSGAPRHPCTARVRASSPLRERRTAREIPFWGCAAEAGTSGRTRTSMPTCVGSGRVGGESDSWDTSDRTATRRQKSRGRGAATCRSERRTGLGRADNGSHRNPAKAEVRRRALGALGRQHPAHFGLSGTGNRCRAGRRRGHRCRRWRVGVRPASALRAGEGAQRPRGLGRVLPLDGQSRDVSGRARSARESRRLHQAREG